MIHPVTTLPLSSNHRVSQIAFHPTKPYLAVQSHDRSVEIFRIRTEEEVRKKQARRKKRAEEKKKQTKTKGKGKGKAGANSEDEEEESEEEITLVGQLFLKELNVSLWISDLVNTLSHSNSL